MLVSLESLLKKKTRHKTFPTTDPDDWTLTNTLEFCTAYDMKYAAGSENRNMVYIGEGWGLVKSQKELASVKNRLGKVFTYMTTICNSETFTALKKLLTDFPSTKDSSYTLWQRDLSGYYSKYPLF